MTCRRCNGSGQVRSREHAGYDDCDCVPPHAYGEECCCDACVAELSAAWREERDLTSDVYALGRDTESGAYAVLGRAGASR